MMNKTLFGAGLVLSAALLAGCQNTREGVEKDAENAAEASKQAAEKSAAEAREAGREVSQAAENAAEATREAGREVAQETREAGREVAQEAREGAAATRDAARTAGQAARETAGAAANAGDAAQQTAQIKSALIADSSIDASSIDVDTDGPTKTVTLKGRVRTAAEKSKAASIATAKAPGYRITNNLEVAH
ncbi:MAG TPA: BON domain-containing protein [Luteitalea sp.]|nr:BON domain-containing protein [Luteitalea sp.]